MDLLTSLMKASITFIDEITKPKSFKDGEDFEDFVRDMIFPEDVYKLIHRTPGYNQNKKDFADESKNPDFTFQCPITKKNFHVECKYRDITGLQELIKKTVVTLGGKDLKNIAPEVEKKIEEELKGKDRVTIYGNDQQFIRHKRLNDTTPVFLALGLNDDYFDEGYDLHVYVIPINDLKVSSMPLPFFNYYAVANNCYFAPERLSDMIDPESFDKAFCIRCGKEILFNPENPLCTSCWEKWFKYKNFLYQEKHCHMCGKESATTVARPLCLSCYKEWSKI